MKRVLTALLAGVLLPSCTVFHTGCNRDVKHEEKHEVKHSDGTVDKVHEKETVDKDGSHKTTETVEHNVHN